MKILVLCLILMCSACGKKTFETLSTNQVESTSDNGTATSEEDILQIQQITSGGGIAYAEDNTFSAETTIGAVVVASNDNEVLVSLGLFEILKNEF